MKFNWLTKKRNKFIDSVLLFYGWIIRREFKLSGVYSNYDFLMAIIGVVFFFFLIPLVFIMYPRLEENK